TRRRILPDCPPIRIRSVLLSRRRRDPALAALAPADRVVAPARFPRGRRIGDRPPRVFPLLVERRRRTAGQSVLHERVRRAVLPDAAAHLDAARPGRVAGGI